MANVNIINGTAVNFAFPTTPGGITYSVLSGKLILQSADQSKGARNERVTDEVGNVTTSAWTDPHDKATLEHVIKGTGLADAITQTTLAALAVGVIITISACANMPDLVATNWEIMDSKISGTNTSAKKLSLTLEKRVGITGPAGA